MTDDLCQCPRCGRMHRHLANNPPASISQPAQAVDREAIARVIDPEAFKQWDRETAHGRKAENGKPWADVVWGAQCDAARTKADAILSLLGGQQ